MKASQQIFFFFFFFFFFISGCESYKPVNGNYESEALKIKRINEKVFQHTSYLKTENFGTVPCNGMIYINGNEAIVFDTPTENNASAELIKWIGKKDIKAIVVTHFHIDCLGGLDQFHTNGVKSYAANLTIELAKKDKRKVLPQNGFDNQYKFQIGNENVYAQYFGEGHTKDNIVGYIPSEKALFGGCLIKQINAQKGNLTDANVSEWPKTVEKLKRAVPEIEIVIPGHGENGGMELLEYTKDLFKEENDRFMFFLHNRFLETHNEEELHPEYGRMEYDSILTEFERSGLNVISEKRDGDVNAREYAYKIVNQIDSLIASGVPSEKITIVGTSKGGYIAQYVSTLANNAKLNFVFIASFRDGDLQGIPEINYCGNILTIFEKSDPLGVSAIGRKESSTCEIGNFKEIELNTGMKHGFLFKPLKEWIEPTIRWAQGDYKIE